MFKKIEFENFNENPFTLFKKDSALIVAGTYDHHNTMTVGWGTFGVLWRTEIAIAYVKPNRYTFEFTNNSKYFVLAWFDDSLWAKEMLKVCGTKSGRDINKDIECGLTPFEIDGGIGYKEARILVVCEKIYQDDFTKESFLDDTYDVIYKDGLLHRRYIGKIVGIYEKCK